MRSRTGTALLVLATCLGVQSAVAQSKAGQGGRTSFGLVGGVNVATFNGSDATGSKTRTGFYGGLAAIVPLGTSLFFQPQALFSMKGATASDSGVTGEFMLNYLEVPLFLGLRIPMQGSGIRPYVMAGPYVGLKIGCKFKISGSGVSAEVDCDNPDVDLGIKSTDFGVVFGAGVDMPMGSGLLSLGARYSMGLSDVITDVNMRNNVLSVGLGYFFGR